MFKKAAVVLPLGLASASSFAAADFSAISSAVDFGTAATAIITILGLVAVVLVAMRGGKMVVRAISG